jgi:hypothetical protein
MVAALADEITETATRRNVPFRLRDRVTALPDHPLKDLLGEDFVIEQKAYLLWTRQGLTYAEIAQVLQANGIASTKRDRRGKPLSRKTVGAYIRSFKLKLAAFRFNFPNCDCTPLLN